MFKFIILILLFFAYSNAKSSFHTEHSYDESINLVRSIQTHGITYGNGEQNVYVFVDPLCPYSRKFISMISKKPKMLSKYKYTIYLYEIPRLHSASTIAAIYSAKEPIKMLLQVMLEEKKASTMVTKKIEAKVNYISRVAQKLHINKRPSIIVQK